MVWRLNEGQLSFLGKTTKNLLEAGKAAAGGLKPNYCARWGKGKHIKWIVFVCITPKGGHYGAGNLLR